MTAASCYSPSIKESACDLVAEESVALFAKLATQALIAEVDLTPKPGLVDRRGSGAHSDLSLEIMCRSAITLKPYFLKMAQASANCVPSKLKCEQLRRIGRLAEQEMLFATNGSNTHKGAIWTLGLLIAACSMNGSANRKAFAVAATAGGIALFYQNEAAMPVTHGYMVQQKFAVPGARGEAQQSFPHVIGVGLPTLCRRRAEGADESIARLDCLLSIMSDLDDTCILYRGGKRGLSVAQVGATAVLAAGGAATTSGRRKLRALDQQLLALNCSPGGSADLLAATLFLDAIESGQLNIECSKVYKEA